MKNIYWNTKDIKDADRILDIVDKERPDLFFLSETDSELLTRYEDEFEKRGYQYFPNPGCERVKIIKNKQLQADLSLQNKYYTTIFAKSADLFITSVHLPSQMFQHMDALKEFLRDFRFELDAEIGGSLDKDILVIGDFNVNPHEKPMIDFDGFAAANSINSRKEITHLGKQRATYYNPTWQLYSRTHFPGTKHFKRPSGSLYDILEYHYLDQVVLSQSLRQKIKKERIDVIESTANFTFFDTASNTIHGSDHLPILYEFKV